MGSHFEEHYDACYADQKRGVKGGFLAPLSANPAFGPDERKGGGSAGRGRAPRGRERATGGWAPLSANPAFGPAERKRGAPRVGGGAPRCRERATGCWGLASKFWKNCSRLSRASASKSGCLARNTARERKFVPLGRDIVLRKKGFGRPVEVPNLSESPLPLRLLSVLFPPGCLGVGVRRSTPLVIVVTI